MYTTTGQGHLIPEPDFDRYENGSSVGLLALNPNLHKLNKPKKTLKMSKK